MTGKQGFLPRHSKMPARGRAAITNSQRPEESAWVIAAWAIGSITP